MKKRTGYKGQKYHVIADEPDGAVKSLGWQNDDKVARFWKTLAKAWRLKNVRLEPVHKEKPHA
jgi:hypothetical protein